MMAKKQFTKWKELKLKHKHLKPKKKIREMLSGNQIAFIWNSKQS